MLQVRFLVLETRVALAEDLSFQVRDQALAIVATQRARLIIAELGQVSYA